MVSILFLFVLISSISLVSSVTGADIGVCQPFQLFETPAPLNRTKQCSGFASSACCGAGIAARAYNWAKEDDGCGVVSGACLTLLTDLSCHTNCAPNLAVNTTAGIPGFRPAICRSWALSIYNACGAYQWCTSSQQQVSTCSFLQTKTTRVRTGNNRYTGVTSSALVGASDTCTNVNDLELNEFARKILQVEVIEDGQGPCNSPMVQPAIPKKNSANKREKNNYGTILAIILVWVGVSSGSGKD